MTPVTRQRQEKVRVRGFSQDRLQGVGRAARCPVRVPPRGRRGRPAQRVRNCAAGGRTRRVTLGTSVLTPHCGTTRRSLPSSSRLSAACTDKHGSHRCARPRTRCRHTSPRAGRATLGRGGRPGDRNGRHRALRRRRLHAPRLPCSGGRSGPLPRPVRRGRATSPPWRRSGVSTVDPCSCTAVSTDDPADPCSGRHDALPEGCSTSASRAFTMPDACGFGSGPVTTHVERRSPASAARIRTHLTPRGSMAAA